MICRAKVMNKTKKVRCPHCQGINTVNIDQELKKHKEPIYRRIFSFTKHEITTPKKIAVTCSNAKCKKSFIINID